MGRADCLREGDFNRHCDRCGFKYKASETRKEWNGLIVCPKCYEPRQPQDFVRGRRDRQSVPDPRPDPDPVFRPTAYVDEGAGMYVDGLGNVYMDGDA